MDTEFEHLRHLGLFGICKQGCKLIYSYKKIFTQITLAFILPLVLLMLFEILVADALFGKLDTGEPNEFEVFSQRPRETSYKAGFWIEKVVYIILLVIFTLLSTSAIIYSSACIYTAKPMTFKTVSIVALKVWKRLFITLVCNTLVMIVYHVIAVLVFVLWGFTINKTNPQAPKITVLVILIILYLVGFVYINAIWQLASVVSVLEPVYGFKAMKKSRVLIKGKVIAASFIFVVVCFPLVVVDVVFQAYVLRFPDSREIFQRVITGIVIFVFVLVLILYGLIIQTVLYFVCKSIHREVVEKSILADHLDGYVGEHVRLRDGHMVSSV